CWPRGSSYFSRSNWAGRIRVGDTWVLDSPANNAIAHHVNLPLFLLGPSLETSATPESVYAELYRAADIENFDTCSLRVQIAGNATLLVNFTHACVQNLGPVVTFYADDATITQTWNDVRIQRPGRPE